MITLKKLQNNGTREVERMMKFSALLGIDLIEVLWSTRRDEPAQVSGYDVPVVDISFDDDTVNDSASASDWIEGTVTFYPDETRLAWGYIYDTDKNRQLLWNSFENDWFRIADKRIREEVKAEAVEHDISTEPVQQVDILIKKTKREKDAELHAKTLQRKLEDMEMKKKSLEKELAIAKGEKVEYLDKRLKGVKAPNRDKILEDKDGKVVDENAE